MKVIFLIHPIRVQGPWKAGSRYFIVHVKSILKYEKFAEQDEVGYTDAPLEEWAERDWAACWRYYELKKL